MTLLEGSEVSCYLFSLADAQEPISYNLLYKDGDVHARGVYPAVDQHVQRTWNIAHNDNYLAIGAVRQPNMYAGPELKGDYGVVYYIDLLLYNKQEYAQNVELLINPRGGKATATVVGGPTEGQQSPHAVWELAEPVEAFEFARLAQLSVPGQSVFRYKLMTMPEGASNYPVRLVLRKVGEVSH